MVNHTANSNGIQKHSSNQLINQYKRVQSSTLDKSRDSNANQNAHGNKTNSAYGTNQSYKASQ